MSTPAHPGQCDPLMIRSVDIFPWNEHFNTGLPEVDLQHRVLVGLLNDLATHIAFASDLVDLNRILAELTEYTTYHFTTEERLWDEYIPDEGEQSIHRKWHNDFIETMERLKADQDAKPLMQVVDETLAYLARWLIRHILEQDRYAAYVVRGMQSGMSMAEAKARAHEKMTGTWQVLLEMVLTIYGALTANTVSLLREIAERKRVEASLHESEERFRMIVERSPIGILLARDGVVLEANEACARMFGYSDRAALRGLSVYALVAPAWRPDVRDRHRRRMRRPDYEDEEGYETVGLRHDGAEFPLMIEPASVRLSAGPTVAAFLVDVTERKRAEEIERVMNRTIKLLSRTNALLVRATDKYALLNGVCRLAVEVGGYLMAWVGYAEDDEAQTVRPVAYYGYEERYLENAHISWGDNPQGRGPTGTAIRTGRRMVSADFALSPEMAPWREAAQRRGYKGSVALPLKVDGRVIGALVIYSGSTEAFREEELTLLDEMAYDLAFGIQSLRLRAAKEAAVRDLERESNKNRALLDNASDGVHVLDEDGRLIEASASFCAMLGYTREELMGMRMPDWDAGDFDDGGREAKFRSILKGSTRVQFNTRHRRRDGSIIDVEVSAFPLTLEGRRVLFNSSRDVTESRRVSRQLERTTEDLRTLLAEFESSLEAERTHIAREVHDELGQILTSLGFAISTVRVKFGGSNPELLELAREMSVLNERALQVARNVAENLRPAILDMGIVAALEWLCDRVRRQTGVRCDFQASNDLDTMDQAQVHTVFRIAQESLTNAMRHAEATRLGISLTLHHDGLHLTVHDNGKGFDLTQRTSTSFGLLGMEERVRSLGGDFRVTSAPEAGTTVSVHMPYRTRQEMP